LKLILVHRSYARKGIHALIKVIAVIGKILLTNTLHFGLRSTCQTHHPTKADLFRDTLANLNDHGIKVNGRHSNRSEHANLIVCDAENFEQLHAYIPPNLAPYL